jgi:hypothetical protein
MGINGEANESGYEESPYGINPSCLASSPETARGKTPDPVILDFSYASSVVVEESRDHHIHFARGGNEGYTAVRHGDKAFNLSPCKKPGTCVDCSEDAFSRDADRTAWSKGKQNGPKCSEGHEAEASDSQPDKTLKEQLIGRGAGPKGSQVAMQGHPREQSDCSYGGAYQSEVAARGIPTCVIVVFHKIRSHGGIVARTL